MEGSERDGRDVGPPPEGPDVGPLVDGSEVGPVPLPLEEAPPSELLGSEIGIDKDGEVIPPLIEPEIDPEGLPDDERSVLGRLGDGVMAARAERVSSRATSKPA